MDKKNLITTVNYRDLMLNKSALKTQRSSTRETARR